VEVPIMRKKIREKQDPRLFKTKNTKQAWRSILEGVPKESPSLSQAYQLTQRASQVGFDWPNIEGVLKKLDEEMGDLLFVLANVSRFLQINPEEALRKTLEKFVSRFHYIETSLRKKGKTLQQSNLFEMDRLWEESKKKKGSK
jgi:tetrapyrrole methylase family protein/MazG family protein